MSRFRAGRDILVEFHPELRRSLEDMKELPEREPEQREDDGNGVKQRKELEREVALMSDGSLEKDILDEKARYALNVSRVDEIVIFK